MRSLYCMGSWSLSLLMLSLYRLVDHCRCWCCHYTGWQASWPVTKLGSCWRPLSNRLTIVRYRCGCRLENFCYSDGFNLWWRFNIHINIAAQHEVAFWLPNVNINFSVSWQQTNWTMFDYWNMESFIRTPHFLFYNLNRFWKCWFSFKIFKSRKCGSGQSTALRTTVGSLRIFMQIRYSMSLISEFQWNRSKLVWNVPTSN